eukprot:Pgem_evm1s5388
MFFTFLLSALTLTTQACNLLPLDYTFVLDSSGSVGQTNFDLTKQFTANVLGSLQDDEW